MRIGAPRDSRCSTAFGGFNAIKVPKELLGSYYNIHTEEMIGRRRWTRRTRRNRAYISEQKKETSKSPSQSESGSESGSSDGSASGTSESEESGGDDAECCQATTAPGGEQESEE